MFIMFFMSELQDDKVRMIDFSFSTIDLDFKEEFRRRELEQERNRLRNEAILLASNVLMAVDPFNVGIDINPLESPDVTFRIKLIDENPPKRQVVTGISITAADRMQTLEDENNSTITFRYRPQWDMKRK